MKTTKIGIVSFVVVVSMLAACWYGNEDRKSVGRFNVASHCKRVGLGFRHDRNDVVGFVRSGPVVVAPEEKAARQRSTP